MPDRTVIRTIYLYLLSFIGLILLVIGCVGFLNMGLKAFVFTKADDERRYYEEFPPRAALVDPRRVEDSGGDALRRAIEDSLRQEEAAKRRQATDFTTSRRHREAAENASFILIGLPLYLYHWRLIRRDAASPS